MKVYYNEINPTAIKWLQASMDAGVISRGDIDTRSIEDVRPTELMGYQRAHFFAGIGGWEIAIKIAESSGWQQQGVLWTGSCPCQSFSTAGKGLGRNDPRHLWPSWFWLIQQCQPSIIFGEQVANALTHGWGDDVATDLEAEGYAFGAAVLPACSVGHPHKRDRLWFVANREDIKRNERIGGVDSGAGRGDEGAAGTDGSPCGAMAHSAIDDDRGITRELSATHEQQAEQGQGRERHAKLGGAGALGNAESIGSREGQQNATGSDEGGYAGKISKPIEPSDEYVANTNGQRIQGEQPSGNSEGRRGQDMAEIGLRNGAGLQWLQCPDGKQRLVESSVCLLVDGLSGKLRKAALHGFGNAIVPEVAAEFIMASEAKKWRGE